MEITHVSIDLAKSVFQIAAFNRAHKIIFNRTVSRAKLIDAVRQLPPGVCIAMEACASAHHWGRTFQDMGFTVALIPPQHVKAFCRVHKSDGHDAIAIAEASQRPNLHTVPVKSIAQQDLAMLMHLRDRITRERTRTANQMRSFASEYGLCFPKNIRALLKGITDALANEHHALSPIARNCLAELMDHVKLLTKRIEALLQQATELAKQQPAFARLQTIPGIGPVVSCTLMAAIGSGHQFDRGRSVASWLGLVPRQNGSGGTTKLLGITKNGNRELRTLLIHGARTVVSHAKKHPNTQMGKWLLGLEQRRGRNRATVAYANKLARVAWSVIRTEQDFDMARAFRSSIA
jgi:transposase